MFLGFVIGYLSLYYYIPWILIVFLGIHLIGTIYSERNSGKIQDIFKLFYQTFIHRAPVKVTEKAKFIPKEYRYNYHLKPSNDIRLQQVRNSSSHSLLYSLHFSHHSFRDQESSISMERPVHSMLSCRVLPRWIVSTLHYNEQSM